MKQKKIFLTIVFSASIVLETASQHEAHSKTFSNPQCDDQTTAIQNNVQELSTPIARNHFFDVDFFDSVAYVYHRKNMEKELNFIMKNSYWLRAKRLYDQYTNKVFLKTNSMVRIPKKIHQIWLGGALPEKYKSLKRSLIKNHPEWEYKLWTEKEIAAFKLTNQTAYDQSKNYAQKSDIARYEILFREGGVYIDTDFLCLQPLDTFHYNFDFYVAIDNYNADFTIQNFIIGSIPKHPILAQAIKTLNIHQNLYPNYYENIQFTTGPFHLTKCYKHYISSHFDRSIAFPLSFFSMPPCTSSNKFDSRCARPETIGFHYADASWIT